MLDLSRILRFHASDSEIKHQWLYALQSQRAGADFSQLPRKFRSRGWSVTPVTGTRWELKGTILPDPIWRLKLLFFSHSVGDQLLSSIWWFSWLGFSVMHFDQRCQEMGAEIINTKTKKHLYGYDCITKTIGITNTIMDIIGLYIYIYYGYYWIDIFFYVFHHLMILIISVSRCQVATMASFYPRATLGSFLWNHQMYIDISITEHWDKEKHGKTQSTWRNTSIYHIYH